MDASKKLTRAEICDHFRDGKRVKLKNRMIHGPFKIIVLYDDNGLSAELVDKYGLILEAKEGQIYGRE